MTFKIQGRWEKRGSVPVYERQDGLRIHKFGLIRPALASHSEDVPIAMIREFEQLTGGNRKRALMLIANKFYPMI